MRERIGRTHREPIAPKRMEARRRWLRFGRVDLRGAIIGAANVLMDMSKRDVRSEWFGVRIRRPLDAFLLFAPRLSSLPRERAMVAYLADGDAVIGMATVAEGDAAAATLPICAVLRNTILCGASGLLLAHNHPSGSALPSVSDVRATRRLVSGAMAIGVALLDHVVIARRDAHSFRLLGLL